MRIIARRTLREFWTRHARAEQPLKAWFAETSRAAWVGPQDVKDAYRHASFLGDKRVVSKIAGNHYRLITHINYDFQIIYIKFVGTYAEYDRIHPETV